MSEQDFVLDVVFDAPPEAVYRALATCDGIRGWWSQFTEFDDREGAIAEFRFPESGLFARMRVAELDPPRRVRWHCVEAEHPPGVSNDPNDWIGTEVVFAIGPTPSGGTRLRFTHVGLRPLQCHDVCSDVRAFYIDTSLRGLVEQGRGQPATR